MNAIALRIIQQIDTCTHSLSYSSDINGHDRLCIIKFTFFLFGLVSFCWSLRGVTQRLLYCNSGFDEAFLLVCPESNKCDGFFFVIFNLSKVFFCQAFPQWNVGSQFTQVKGLMFFGTSPCHLQNKKKKRKTLVCFWDNRRFLTVIFYTNCTHFFLDIKHFWKAVHKQIVSHSKLAGPVLQLPWSWAIMFHMRRGLVVW